MLLFWHFKCLFLAFLMQYKQYKHNILAFYMPKVFYNTSYKLKAIIWHFKRLRLAFMKLTPGKLFDQIKLWQRCFQLLSFLGLSKKATCL